MRRHKFIHAWNIKGAIGGFQFMERLYVLERLVYEQA
jgi:hypothetical protein